MVLNLTTVEDTIMKRLFATVLALAVLALGSGARLLAHEGHEHKVMGTVTMAAADHVMLKDKDGKDVMVKVTKDTKVKAKPAVKVEEIKVGTRVVVTAVEEKDKSMTAKTIEVGARQRRSSRSLRTGATHEEEPGFAAWSLCRPSLCSCQRPASRVEARR